MSLVLEWMAQQGHKDAEYIGDGLYASHDGFVVWLAAERSNGIHFVGLEPPVFTGLMDFVKRVEENHENPGFWTGDRK